MLHNLLPKQSKRELRNEYIVRMLSVTAFLFSGAVLIGAISLVPAYISLSSALETYEVSENEAPRDADQTPIHELSRVAGLLETLTAKLEAEPMTDLLDEVVSAHPPGIELTAITFERSPLSFSLRGVASTRDALVTYKRALEGLDRVAEVSSPISDLAKSTNLEFTLTVALTARSS